MPNYTPKSEEALAKESLMQDGEYDFTVSSAEEKQSKKGSDMIVLNLHVYDDQGSARTIYDYIVFGNSFGERKFRHAAAGCGLIDKYNAGNLTASDFTDKSGRCEIKIQESTNPDYPLPKNIVSDYVPKSGSVADKKIKEGRLPEDVASDSIPF